MFRNTTIKPKGIALIVATILFESYMLATAGTITDLNRFLVRLVLIGLVPACCGLYFFVMHYGKTPQRQAGKDKEAA